MVRTLPFWQIFTKALSLVWEKRAFALGIIWPLALATAVLAAAMLSDSAPVYWSGPERPEFSPVSLPQTALVLVQAFLTSVIAVYWHRNILLQETSAPPVPLRFDAALWRYVGYALALGLITFVILIITASALVPLTSIGLPTAIAGLLAVGLALGLLLVPLRCSLVLPAAAIGRRDIGLGQSWTLTRGNTLRLLWLQLLLVAFGFVGGFVVGLLRGALSIMIGGPHFLLKIAGNLVVNVALTLVMVGIMSLCYVCLLWDLPDKTTQTKE